MRCEIYDRVRAGGTVTTQDCEREATHELPEGTNPPWRLCRKHFDAMVETLEKWRDGGSTYRHETMAKRYLHSHPEVVE